MNPYYNLQKEIIDTGIDIDSLNEFIQYEENGKRFSINKDGELIYEEIDKPWYAKIYNLIKKIFKILKWITGDEEKQIVGIINLRNNCYLNAGLQILSRCYPLLLELLKNDYEKDKLMKSLVETLTTLLFKKDKYYNPSKFIKYFCDRNKEFVDGQQNCSQDFIRTILRNINDSFPRIIRYENYLPDNEKEFSAYKTYIFENKIFPESKAHSFFSGILKLNLTGNCSNCGNKINDYSFSNFVDQLIYLDSFSRKCKFSDILLKNFGYENKATMKCPKCKEKVNLKSISKFVKIPEIFIFTLERYLIPNKVPVEPDEFINLYDFVDESYDIDKSNCHYELFAINIRIGKDLSFGHEICQIKLKNNWFTIDDSDSYPRQREYNEYSYGLFYRKISLK